MAGRTAVKNLSGEQGTEGRGAGSYTGQWRCFMVIADAVDMPKEYGSVAVYEGPTYPQGFVFYGLIHGITVDSGVIQLFNTADPSIKAAATAMGQG